MKKLNKNAPSLVIIGPGRWGSALAKVAKSKTSGIRVLDENSTPQDWDHAFRSPNTFCILSCPFKAMENVLQNLKGRKILGAINASKGIDRKTLFTFSELAKKYLKSPFGTLSGPTFAQEVLEGLPSACVLASANKKFAKEFSKQLTTSKFRVYPSFDPQGVEICGAIKNVLAIACGISDGLKLGYNARAALLTRGLREMVTVVKRFGGKPSTVFGLAGAGDLWLTATGELSRNRQFGMLLAKSYSAEQALKKVKGPVEGLYTAKQIQNLVKKYRLDLPICQEVGLICFSKKKPKLAIQSLMRREIRPE
ncbi:MAG: NAD(P)H-dependent glycerol-3-phosphate dehydrogenase [Deltaproteobacteria bacterium]|nr:NAD(P)H-dependent glycerol-3-phosphate dehydrogenase [Deltaproteobacteria bacterium]